jgi:hypothetical protein
MKMAAPSSKNFIRNPGEEEEESESRQHVIFRNHGLLKVKPCLLAAEPTALTQRRRGGEK